MPVVRLPEDSKYPKTAVLITNALRNHHAHLTREERRHWKQSDFAEGIGMQASKFSEVKGGVRVPTLSEIWAICQGLGIPVEKLIQAAACYKPDEFLDVAALEQIVAAHATRDIKERTYILDCLRFVLSDEAKKLRWEKSTYKQMADMVLCSAFDAYTKAKFFADVVWDWYQAKKGGLDLARPERKTDEMAVVAS